MLTSNRRKLAALVLPFALIVAACGSDGDSEGASTTGGTTVESAPADETTTTADTMGDDSAAAAPEGEGCAAVPTDDSDEGSFAGMADDPVATAASNNPALKTLVAAVTAAGLGDTLNTGGPFTVFAPVDDAFAKIPAETMDSVMADPTGQLTSILTYHVIPERIEPADLDGTYATVNGAELTISGGSPSFDVGDGQATVICSGIQTANATVYLIDTVLMPPAA